MKREEEEKGNERGVLLRGKHEMKDCSCWMPAIAGGVAECAAIAPYLSLSVQTSVNQIGRAHV